MASYYFERTLNMPIEKVWSVIGDFENSPGPDISITVEKRAPMHPRGFTYRIVSGAPIKDYFGKVTFEDIAGRTLIRWSVTMKPKIPFTGRICCKVSERAVQQLIDSVEKHQ